MKAKSATNTGPKPTAPPGPFGVCALATTRQTARVLTQLYDRHLSAAGIEAAQFALLMSIEALSAQTQTELGRSLSMDKTTLSRNLKLLRAKGWLATAAAANDGRQRRVSLSASGRAQLAEAKPGWFRAQESLRAGMTEKQWRRMWSAMRATMQAAMHAL